MTKRHYFNLCSFSLAAFLLLLQKSATGSAISAGIGTGTREWFFNVEKPVYRKTPVQNSIAPKFRLPYSVQPQSYKLEILIVLNKSPDPKRYEPWTTEGTLRILIKAKEAVTAIKMHKDPDLVSVKDKEIKIVKQSSGAQVRVLNSTYEDKKADLWVLNLASPLEVNETYEIFMPFKGNVSTDKLGLYRAKYVDENGNDRWMALTQFAAIGFRKMIPGFDEPRFKTEFTLSIARPKGLRSVSNAKILRGNETDPKLPKGYVWDRYNKTVKIPTYLLALMVSNYKSISADPKILGKPVELLARPSKIDNGWGNYGLSLTAQVLKAYQKEFNQSYLETKMAAVAVPNDYFLFDAMENPGMITYKESVLLYKENISLETERLRTAETVSHENSHQWFGNLVTIFWFDSVWLNEGFATYMSYLGMSYPKVAPEYDPQNQILYKVVHDAMRVDSSAQSHPVINPVTVDDVISMSFYDTIAYDKGASLLRMMEGFLGKKTLMMGLAKYLDNQKFGSAVQDDFFNAVNQVAHAQQKLPKDMKISTIMNTYTRQKGIPLVCVSKQGPRQLRISQERYRYNLTEAVLPSDSDLRWEIPIKIQSGLKPNSPSPYFWLHKNTSVKSFPVDTSSWIIVNPDAFGYYRTLYDTPLTLAIQEQLNKNHSLMSPLTKGQIIEDYFQFAEQDHIKYTTALGMTKFLGISPSLTDHTFWFPALRAFTKIYQLLQDEPVHYANLRRYLNTRLQRFLLHSGGWAENEHGISVLLHFAIWEWMSKLDSPLWNIVSDASYKKWLKMIQNGDGRNLIGVDLQTAFYCHWVRSGKKNATKLIRNEFHKESEPGHRNRLLNGLACSHKTAEIIELMRWSIQPEILDLGLTTTILGNIARNSNANGRFLLFGFIRDNWEKLVNLTAKDEKRIETTVISRTVTALSLFYKTKSHLENLKKLMTDIETKNSDHFKFISASLTASYKQIQKNLEWFEKHGKNISDWLAVN